MSENIPAHVPAELVVDLDMYALPGGERDPQLAWAQFKGKGPLVFSPRNGGHWVPTEGRDIAAMWRDAENFSSAKVSIPDHGGKPLIPIETDGAAHQAYRNNVLPIFSPAAVDAMEPDIRRLAIDLIEGFRPRGECEFVSEFAEQLPLIVFLRLCGLPLEDRIPLHDLVETFARHPGVAEKQAAYAGLQEYLEGWIARRRAQPGDDAISRVIQSRIDNRPYNHDEILATCALMLLGGLDTVASSLGFWVLHLARHPADRAFIRTQRDNLGPVINEMMRRFGVPNLGRIVANDLEYKGVLLKKGDRVLLAPSLYSLDESLFPNPEIVDLNRRPNHLGFGSGPHICAGATLARCEFKLFLQEWLDRIPDFDVAPGRPLVMKAAPTNTVETLWLTWG